MNFSTIVHHLTYFRKHLDRLVNMFFCTSGCDMTFGSKDEWRRHENRVHWTFEKWKCTLPENPETAKLCDYESCYSNPFKNHLKTNHLGFAGGRTGSIDVQGFKIFKEDFPTTFWCGFCTHRLEINGDAVERIKGRLNHVEDHLKERNNWPHGTADTWIPEPLGGCRTVRTLDCQQQGRTSLSLRHRKKSAPDAVGVQQPSSNLAIGIPRISVIPDMEQAQATLPPEPTERVKRRVEQPSQTERSRSSSSLKPRRRTNTRTCVSPHPSSTYSYTDDLGSVDFEEWVTDWSH